MAYERLSAQDAMFLHIEAPHQPQHVGALAVCEGGPLRDERGHVRLDDLRRLVASRLHLVPRFRQRIATVPFEQGRPVWVDDDRFDIDYHVRLTALPRPGSEEQLLSLFERLQAQPLDRRRPLWELWFVDGLGAGPGPGADRVAVVQKTHHCLADGLSAVDLATVLYDLGPETTWLDPPPWRPAPAPSAPRLLVESLVERAVEPAEAARSVRAALRVPRQVLARARDVAGVVAANAPTAPRLPWNAKISPHRRWLPVRVPLEQVTALKAAASADPRIGARVSVNDLVLAQVTAGLRRFLEHRGRPADGLVVRAMVPVAMRAAGEREAATAAGGAAVGNRVSMVNAGLPVGTADPLARLRAVVSEMQHLKGSGAAAGGDLLMRLSDHVPPNVLGTASRLLVRTRAFNLTVSNVPGPPFPLYVMGARVLEAFPYVQILDGQGLTVACLSYEGQLGFGITGDRELLGDLEVVAEGVRAGLEELRDLLLVPATTTAGRHG